MVLEDNVMVLFNKLIYAFDLGFVQVMRQLSEALWFQYTYAWQFEKRESAV